MQRSFKNWMTSSARKLTSCGIILLLVLGSTPAFSQNGSSNSLPKVECPDPDHPTFCFAAGLHRGDPAPMAGDLLAPDLALDLFQLRDSHEQRVAAAVTATAAFWRAEGDLRLQAATSSIAIKQAEIDALRDSLPRFWEKPLFVGIVSSILTGLVVGGTYVAIKSLD